MGHPHGCEVTKNSDKNSVGRKAGVQREKSSMNECNNRKVSIRGIRKEGLSSEELGVL